MASSSIEMDLSTEHMLEQYRQYTLEMCHHTLDYAGDAARGVTERNGCPVFPVTDELIDATIKSLMIASHSGRIGRI